MHLSGIICYLPSFSRIDKAEKITEGKDTLARTVWSWASSDRLAQTYTKHFRISLGFIWCKYPPHGHFKDPEKRLKSHTFLEPTLSMKTWSNTEHKTYCLWDSKKFIKQLQRKRRKASHCSRYHTFFCSENSVNAPANIWSSAKTSKTIPKEHIWSSWQQDSSY